MFMLPLYLFSTNFSTQTTNRAAAFCDSSVLLLFMRRDSAQGSRPVHSGGVPFVADVRKSCGFSAGDILQSRQNAAGLGAHRLLWRKFRRAASPVKGRMVIGSFAENRSVLLFLKNVGGFTLFSALVTQQLRKKIGPRAVREPIGY